MAISRTQNVSATATSVAITSCTAGDIIVVFAYNGGSTTIPTLLAGFTNIIGIAGTQQAMRCGYTVAVGGETNSGTWTNATAVVCLVYRGASGTLGTIGGSVSGSSTSVATSGFTPTVTAGTSWYIGFSGARSATSGMASSPTGGTPTLTTRTNQLTVNGYDGTITGTCPAQSFTVSPTSRWQSISFELKVAAARQLTIPIVQGAYGLTGQPVTTLWGQRSIVTPQGSYALTGKAVALPKGKGMPAQVGRYAVTAVNLIDGDPVSLWPDVTGSNTFTGSSTYKTGILNGKSVVRMGASDQLSASIFYWLGGQPTTVFIVFKQVTGYPAGYNGVGPVYAHGFSGSYPYGLGCDSYGHAALTDYQGNQLTGSAVIEGAFHIVTGISALTASLLFTDGTQVASGTLTVQGIGQLVMGLQPAYGVPWQGDIAAIIVYNVVLSSTDRANIEAFLAGYYGLAVAGGTPVDPRSIGNLQAYWNADDLGGGGRERFLIGRVIAVTKGAYALSGQVQKLLRGYRLDLSGGGGGGAPVIDDSYPETNYANSGIVSNIRTRWGQTFVSGGGTLTKAKFYVFKSGAPTGNCFASLWAVAAGSPTGTALATSDVVNTATLSTYPPPLTDFNFTGVNQYNMAAGTTYAIVFEWPTAVAGDNLRVGIDDTSPTHSGEQVVEFFGSWGATTSDTLFYVYVAGSGGASGVGSYTYTGQPVTFTRAVVKILAAAQGAFALTGQTVGFIRARVMPLVQGAYLLTGKPVGLIRTRLLAIVQGSYLLTGQAVSLLRGKLIGLVKGAYALNGQAVGLFRTRTMPIVKGAYALGGQAVNLLSGHTMPLVKGSYALGGQAVSLLRGRLIGLVKGAYALNGQAVGFIRTRIMPIVQGAYSLAGQTVTLSRVRALTLAVVQGSYTLAGQVVNFPRSRIMPLAKGQYNLTGQAVGFLRSRIMPLVQGAYALNGQAVSFLRGRVVAISQGAYGLSGLAVTLRKSGLAILGVVTGAYNLTGQAVAFPRSRIMPLVKGQYNLTGQALGFLRGRLIPLVKGQYNLTGQAVGFLRGRLIGLVKGSYALAGQAVTLLEARRIVLTQGAYSVVGQPVAMKLGRRLAAIAGAYTLVGNPVGLTRSRRLPMVTGGYVLNGQLVLLRSGRRITPTTGIYGLSGQGVLFAFSGGELWKFYAGSVTQSSLLVTTAASALKVSGAASTLVGAPALTASTFAGIPMATSSGLAISVASSQLKVEKTD